MAGPHFKKHLIHLCDVQRRTDAQSASGELIPTWSTVIVDVPCRYVERLERFAQESQGFPKELEHRLLMNNGVDVRIADRVVNIVDRSDSSVVDAGPFTIDELLKRNSSGAHHISIELERIE